MKFRFNTMSFFLICIFSAICISSVSLFAAIEERTVISEISRGSYSENAVHFTFKEDNWCFESLINQLLRSRLSDFVLIYDDYEKHIRQIYVMGNNDPPPMLSGRYFNEDDFDSGKAHAVIGTNRLHEVINKNGRQQIKVENTMFDVIGIVGYRIHTMLDDMIIVNADALSYKSNNNNIFILDAYSGKPPGHCINVYKDLEQNVTDGMSQGNQVPITLLEIKPGGIDRLLQSIISITTIYLLLIVCYVLCSIAISFEWISKKRREIAVKRLIGWSDRRLKIEIYLKYFIFAFIGSGLGLMGIYFFGTLITKVEYILAVVLLNIFMGWLITIPPVKKMLKVSVTEVLR
ncbi:ABC transporter permease [Candidatus Contubernalis alkaliaceticus]|uniref:ABC transporter permease n=1 Tax=Candidatus Contubernalis alkaliaceticus TaxID=338645 RepID=UPI001F4C1F46|nr:ABC transporter permease [Candidatus Contubernalis alkalaceticus]UNC93270.1 ABC transporter permease [Candidatus Contubernalis alkalaceticus]